MEKISFEKEGKEEDIYTEEALEAMFDDDTITDSEQGFMIGYLAS